MFTCSRCSCEKEDNERIRRADARNWCHQCWLDYSQEWRDKNRRKIRDGLLRKKYGISIEQYDEMLAEQGGVCKICGLAETARDKFGEIKMLAVDHDHDTDVNRGLLCQRCNVGIGHLPSPALLLAAADYLLGTNETASTLA